MYSTYLFSFPGKNRYHRRGTLFQVPTDRELYLICDVIGRAGEVEILDVDVPGAEVAAAAAPAAGGAAPASNSFLEIMQRRPPMHRWKDLAGCMILGKLYCKYDHIYIYIFICIYIYRKHDDRPY